jgi:hypothetical protein
MMTDSVIVHQSSLRTQWWLVQKYCVSHHSAYRDKECSNSHYSARSDNWYSNSASVNTTYTVMTDTAILRQSTLRTQWWLIQQYCVSRHYVHSDDWYSNIASVDTTYTVMTDTAILRQSSLGTQFYWCSYRDPVITPNTDEESSNRAPRISSHSDDWRSKHAPFITRSTLMTNAAIVHQTS